MKIGDTVYKYDDVGNIKKYKIIYIMTPPITKIYCTVPDGTLRRNYSAKSSWFGDSAIGKSVFFTAAEARKHYLTTKYKKAIKG